MPNLEAAIDDAAQMLMLTRRTAVQRVQLVAPAPTASLPMTRAHWGAAINYDLSLTRAGRRGGAAGLVDAVVHGPRGYFFAGAVVAAGDGARERTVTRLDSGFVANDPARGRRLTIGDVVAGASEQSRPVRLGGIQFATDFELRPDLVTFPIPAIAGSAAVPSAVDLIVNGSRRSAGTVRAGQFAVTDVPLQTGVNAVTVAVRDALGRETRQTVSTYVSRAMLRPGLTAFSLEAGLVRTGYATRADRYAGLAGSGTLRVGLDERLTGEVHGEVGKRTGVVTAGGAMGLGAVGMVVASAGVSVAATPVRRGGAQLAIGFERVGRPLALSVHYVRNSRGWTDLASDSGAPTRDHLLSLSLGLDLDRWGRLGATLIERGAGRLERRPVAGPPLVLPSSSLASLTYSVRVASRLNLVANAGADWRTRRSGYLSLSALMVFGRRSSAHAGLLARTGGTSATVEYSQVALEPGDIGYRAAVARGGIDRVATDVSYQGRRGYYAAQVEQTNGAVAARLSARGALVIGGDSILATDRLFGSYAVIDTHGQAGVHVYRDNRPAGVTDRHGKRVIANLKPFEATKISLDPLQIGDAMVVDRTETWVKPAARSGVLVRFALRPTIAARVGLVDDDGRAIPVGARASVNGGGEVPVGLDGELYADDLRPENDVAVRLRGGDTCVAQFAAPAAGAVLRRIGPIACRRDRRTARQAAPSSLYFISR